MFGLRILVVLTEKRHHVAEMDSRIFENDSIGKKVE